MKKTGYRVLGVMSGTSLDGIDLVYTEIETEQHFSYKIIYAETVPYPEEWRQKLSHAINLEAADLNQLDVDYTTFLASVIKDFIDKYDLHLLEAVCSHGHTVKHRPKQGVTYQIGNLPVLAEFLEIPVVCDFRVQDVELGGQGAPLVPIGDRLLFNAYRYCINLGGFANISMEKDSQRIAYDICPVNTVFNYFMQKTGKEYDQDGEMARSGLLNEKLLSRLNALKFYKKEPPKSLGIEWVNSHIIPILEDTDLSIPDLLRTYAEHVAIQLDRTTHENQEADVLVTGGGVKNLFLMERFRSLSGCNIIVPDVELIDFKEALIFALLGVLKLRGEVNVLSSVTGAKIDHSSGRVYEP
ncbi:anhydro-N-acetylmuramic acid kinase [Christiangramia sabulilitoris]|uniref:Anhydro-N-acetylmuramic acid kinase n=1 Tax=Christiangramia sabulilitoris TaxID=2583991 RepID=A0A550I452_9FLAO|nr:anhydro-N-acetylmuramic acid kinase [Christiangramia sabulilitoris]TRO65747.1 anhydro-N-acetylmuramic acid kinase [Christiangramia sabulilitoris]